jgi:hypothetical protein
MSTQFIELGSSATKTEYIISWTKLMNDCGSESLYGINGYQLRQPSIGMVMIDNDRLCYFMVQCEFERSTRSCTSAYNERERNQVAAIRSDLL